jgi:hypothetical protein
MDGFVHKIATDLNKMHAFTMNLPDKQIKTFRYVIQIYGCSHEIYMQLMKTIGEYDESFTDVKQLQADNK